MCCCNFSFFGVGCICCVNCCKGFFRFFDYISIITCYIAFCQFFNAFADGSNCFHLHSNFCAVACFVRHHNFICCVHIACKSVICYCVIIYFHIGNIGFCYCKFLCCVVSCTICDIADYRWCKVKYHAVRRYDCHIVSIVCNADVVNKLFCIFSCHRNFIVSIHSCPVCNLF